jgi:glycosyltransferase involved in cell wall biosynthesis
MSESLPFISIVVPIRNEEETIDRLVRSLLDQDYPHDRYEVLMADGGSTDKTQELLARADTERRVRVLPNPGRTAPAALNVAIAEAKGDIVTRVDGHSFVAPDYLSKIVAVMKETGAAVVGGPVLMHADTPFRRALVTALYSPIAVGAVPYRTLKQTYVRSLSPDRVVQEGGARRRRAVR